MKGRKLLLVVDSPITRRLIRHGVERGGLVVLEASDPPTALRLIREKAPELALIDLALSEHDAYALARQLREAAGTRCRILAISTPMTPREEARLSDVGFDGLVTKPIDATRLLQDLDAHLTDEDDESFGQGLRLIVADDDPMQLKLARLRLTRAGFQVTVARDGTEALAVAREVPPDVIVADIMMPGLDGFALCESLRADEALAHLPLVLMTNSYVDEADRKLAERVGASAFVVRTPRFDEVLRALRRVIAGGRPPVPAPLGAPRESEQERSRRLVHQLERQVAINAELRQRCASLSAELSVLAGIAEALSNDRNIDGALDAVLAACFDAGGVSRGVLYLRAADGRLEARRFGASQEPDAGLQAVEEALIRRVIDEGRALSWPDHDGPADEARRLLAAFGARSAVIAPLGHGQHVAGALVLLADSLALQEHDRLSFAEGVAHQIGLVLALAQSFQDKDASERAAREQADLLRSILQSIPDGVLVVNAEGELTQWNAAAEQLLGQKPREHPLREWPRALGLHRPDGQALYDWADLPLARALRGEAVEGTEIFMRPTPEQGTWLSVTARPHLAQDRTGRGAVGVFRDVTAQRKTQAQLVVADRLASVGMLAGGVAHEINNPLAVVMANLDLALGSLTSLAPGSVEPEDLRQLEEDLRSAREAAERVRDIVRDLKIFSRGGDDTTGPVDVEHVLESSLRMARNEIRHRARVVREYEKNVPPVNGSEAQLGQVFLNLIVNAAQAIPEGRAHENEIRVSVARGERPRTVVVKVTDTGCGMSPELLERVFVPFFSTKPPGAGTGLGLSICHRIVSALDGTISIESTPGQGTCVTVELVAASGTSGSHAQVVPTDRPARRGHVLLVDDEPAVREAVRRALSASHGVSTVESATEALERIQAGMRYDVIICDLMMPVMSGMELYATLERTVPEQASCMVFLTGGAFTPEAHAFLDEVRCPRMEKPFEVQALRSLVNSLIR